SGEGMKGGKKGMRKVGEGKKDSDGVNVGELKGVRGGGKREVEGGRKIGRVRRKEGGKKESV
ncbi:hypothetical protein, partial [Neisseria sicca]|uniref:hypothetical protein n=1 Tax=Neisseria sicca TaxID=490 RepID=UPI00164A0BCC